MIIKATFKQITTLCEDDEDKALRVIDKAKTVRLTPKGQIYEIPVPEDDEPEPPMAA